MGKSTFYTNNSPDGLRELVVDAVSESVQTAIQEPPQSLRATSSDDLLLYHEAATWRDATNKCTCIPNNEKSENGTQLPFPDQEPQTADVHQGIISP
jgi:hypothetical protein